MTARELTRDEQICARMSLAYREAIEQSNRSALVTIHVGQDVYRVLRRIRERLLDENEVPAWARAERLTTFHGFPIVEEIKWATEAIRVCSGKDIP